jgi:hypothetical protein
MLFVLHPAPLRDFAGCAYGWNQTPQMTTLNSVVCMPAMWLDGLGS